MTATQPKRGRKFFNFVKEFTRALVVILVLLTIYAFWRINQQRDYYQQYITHTTRLHVLIQEIAKYVGESIWGPKLDTFENLKNAAIKTEEEINILKNGIKEGEEIILPPSPNAIQIRELSRFSATWQLIKPKVSIIFNNAETILNLDKTGHSLISSIEKIREIYRNIIDELGNSSANENKRILEIAKELDLIEKITDDIQGILTIASNTTSFQKAFNEKVNLFFNNTRLIQTKNTTPLFVQKFSEIEKYLGLVRNDVDLVNKMGDLTDKIHAAISEVFSVTPLLANLTKNLEEAYGRIPKANVKLEIIAYVLVILFGLTLLVSVRLYRKENQYYLKITEDENKAMQAEIEKLLQELPEIASGNKAVELIEGPLVLGSTSAITESFAYALNTLRNLVYNIGKTARNVSMAASDAQKITKELATSSGNQAREIVEVTASVSAMASSIEQVSTNASESARVALESVNIAGEGGKVVRSTINGMERIQAQIQETSNYMRRLSDSSQEIGEIVSLIDGIADQTNILSLNAAIQAAMAGEAGRGFAVVADEVQRLAEKVSYATKEIGSLVRSIQTDTSQVIGAMEQTKAQVLEEVNSAQEAGSTLEKIEMVSRRLSDLIQNISSSASEQAMVSGKISHIMNDIKGIAKQMASGTVTTVDLIGKLMQFVTDLRNSVVELKLPDDIR